MTARLRILSGAHKGAELDLTPGDWSVGSDALCDILLSDTAPQQATLRVDEDGGVLLLPAPHSEDASLLGGQNVPAEGCPLPHFARVDWGVVCVAVGPCDAPWPSITLPNVKEDKNAEPPEESPLSLTALAAEKNYAGNTRKKTQGLAGDDGFLGHKSRWKDASARFSPARLLVVFLLLALSAGGVWHWAVPAAPQQHRENIEAVLRAQGLKPSAFEVEEYMGAWTVRGVVNDDKKLQDVSAILHGLDMVLHLDILSRQAVANALEARITTEGARLKVSQRGDIVRLAGYAYDATSLQTLLQPLETDCQRAELRQDIIFWQELRQPLKESLAALKLQGRVRLTPGPYTVAMDTTALSASQQEALHTLEREVTDMTRGISPLVRPVSAIVPNTFHKPQGPALKTLLCEQLQVKALMGKQGGALVIVFEGKEYGPGAHLPNGMQVQEVRPEYVTLVQGERLEYCPLR